MAKKIATYQVTVEVDDKGQFDEDIFRDAINVGLSIVHDEGSMTAYDDETTEIIGWNVTHIGTV